ncbi:MAG: nucleoside hydrolase [Verrucomicrobiota bacterium]|nr:nucleoside hydrolase [Limisphaera sp.]MDW8382953.1 nucleoside hydrolase [Verrucomicrobiota bacterium]
MRIACWKSIALGFCLTVRSLYGHGGFPLILDADWAADDARAVVGILTDPNWEVLAVVATEGASPADAGATYAARLLQALGESHLPVGRGRRVDQPDPPFRAHVLQLAWESLGPLSLPPGGFPPAAQLVMDTLRAAKLPVLYVCTGPLTTLADVVRTAPELTNRIERVLWYGSTPGMEPADWNTRWDPEAVHVVAQSGLTVEVVGYPRSVSPPTVSAAWLKEVVSYDGPAARVLRVLLMQGHGAELVQQGHLRFWDDLVALRVLDPDMFEVRPATGQPRWMEVQPKSPGAIRQIWRERLCEAPLRQTVVLRRFPSEPGQMRADLQPLAETIQNRHGWEEWKAVVLTSELHRHLGTWSIVGAKMGLRARELLQAGPDELRVTSLAGLRPPLSCVNDGLQVATGASLGRGTIRVVSTETPQCAAVFTRGEHQLRLRLRDALVRQVEQEIALLQQQHGGLTPAYFDAVRQVALRHWLEMDRRSIFEESWLPAHAAGAQEGESQQ